MDERCEVLKSFGAKFYQRTEDCPDIASTLQDAIESGERHEKLLQKMEDMRYLDKWLEGIEGDIENDLKCGCLRRASWQHITGPRLNDSGYDEGDDKSKKECGPSTKPRLSE